MLDRPKMGRQIPTMNLVKMTRIIRSNDGFLLFHYSDVWITIDVEGMGGGGASPEYRISWKDLDL